jgi:hypothetical protein
VIVIVLNIDYVKIVVWLLSNITVIVLVNINALFQNCTEKKSGTSCKLWMRRFRDTSGTYKLVSMIGFEKLGRAMGERE